MFRKLTATKILGYRVTASYVNLIFRLKLAKFIIKPIDLFFSSCRTTTDDGNTRK